MNRRIMVVDDEPLVCRLLSYQLGGAGYDVATFQSGFEALGQMSIIRPDLIILDVMMPEVSGWDLCRQIRSASAIPIIMLTAKQGDNDVVAGLTSGADDYIGKPFSLPQLLARVEAVLRRAHKYTELRSDYGERKSAFVERRSPGPALVQAEPAQPEPVVQQEPPAAPRPVAAPAVAAPHQLLRLGQSFSLARQSRSLSLHDAERGCGVRWEYLQAIEREHFDFMPRTELRHALRTYSSYLGIDLRPFTAPRPPARRTPVPQGVALSAMLVLLVMMVFVLGLYVL
jgi:DNA-binding response OmpR family regulator